VAANRTLDRAVSVRLLDGVRSGTWGAPLALAGLMLLAFIGRMWLNARVDAPWIMADELAHSEMAKSFADGDGLEVRGLPSYARTLYPVLISPAWLADSVETAFAAAKTINTVAMTLACVPLYLWARRLVSEGWALAAAALLLLLPAFAYTGTLMTESAFLPLFVLALWAFARALETPTVVWQLGAVAAALAATAVRLQGLVLLAVLVTAIVLDALAAGWGGNSRVRAIGSRLRSFAATGIALLAGALALLVYGLASSGGLTGAFGGYRTVLELEYSLWDGLRWTVFHAAELVFAVGVLPAAAFLLLAGAWLRPSSGPAERSFVCVTAAALVWIVPQAGFFASRYSERIEERNMFYLEPLLLLALVVWVARGAPRPLRATAVAVAVPLALLPAIPIERLFNVSLLSDTFALIPLMRLSTLLDGGVDSVRALLAVGGVVAGLLFVLVPRRFAATTIVVVAAFLAMSAWSVAGTLRDQAKATRLETHTTNANWIDDRVGAGADVPFIFTADLMPNPHLLWQTEFWNRSVGDVYGLNAEDPTSVPVVGTTVDARGRIVRASDGRPLAPLFVVAQPGLDIVGEQVAADGRLVLYRASSPLRLESQVDGVYGDGWSGTSATYTSYSARSDAVLVEAGRAGWGGPDTPGQVTIAVERVDSGRQVSAVRWVVHSGSKRTFRLKAPAAPFRVKVRVQPTFSPAQFGQPDTRQLGVQLSFRPE
jgi:Dolichyl-phosphate-mannose-protein mannosyltransferase